MNEILKALTNGQVVKVNSINEIFYKKVNGNYYYASTNELFTAWALSNATDELFLNEEMWKIVK